MEGGRFEKEEDTLRVEVAVAAMSDADAIRVVARVRPMLPSEEGKSW